MTTDNRTTNQFTDEQIEAACVAYEYTNDLIATERERDDIETRLSEYLCDSTGGKLSKTGYDVRTMVAHTEDYYDGLHADARKEIEAERDAALAALARVRAIHQREVIAVHPGIGEDAWCPACQEHWPCSTVAALDWAPEPEVKP